MYEVAFYIFFGGRVTWVYTFVKMWQARYFKWVHNVNYASIHLN